MTLFLYILLWIELSTKVQVDWWNQWWGWILFIFFTWCRRRYGVSNGCYKPKWPTIYFFFYSRHRSMIHKFHMVLWGYFFPTFLGVLLREKCLASSQMGGIHVQFLVLFFFALCCSHKHRISGQSVILGMILSRGSQNIFFFSPSSPGPLKYRPFHQDAHS